MLRRKLWAPEKAKELWVLTTLVIVTTSVLFGLYSLPSSRAIEFSKNIVLAFLAATLTKCLILLATFSERPDPLVSFRSLGMVRVIDPLGDEELQKRMTNADSIKILKTWFPENAVIEQGLESAITRKKPAQVRLLLANPRSTLLAQRSQGANLQPNSGAFRVIEALRNVALWAGDKNVDVEVGLYDSWPGCPVIWSRGNTLMGFYFRGRASPRWPWIEVERGSQLDQILESQFDSLWDLKETIKLTTRKNPDPPAMELRKWLEENGSGFDKLIDPGATI